MHPVEHIESLDNILDEFVARAHRMAWCNLATLDGRGRPRSRVVHPIWDGATGWIGTLRSTPKVREITRDPHISLAYIGDVARPVYADCLATWIDAPSEKTRIWELFRSAPPPLGYDPASVFGSADNPDFGLLKLTPWRLEVTNWPVGTRVWRAATP